MIFTCCMRCVCNHSGVLWLDCMRIGYCYELGEYIDIECCNRLIACHIFFIQQWWCRKKKYNPCFIQLPRSTCAVEFIIKRARFFFSAFITILFWFKPNNTTKVHFATTTTKKNTKSFTRNWVRYNPPTIEALIRTYTSMLDSFIKIAEKKAYFGFISKSKFSLLERIRERNGSE